MFILDYNPVKKRWDEELSCLSNEQVRLIELGPNVGENLKILKRTRREKKDGDIFVCTLNGIIYYYGKILQANICNPSNNWINGCILVCIFLEKTIEKNLKNFKGDYSNLLISPLIVTSQYWSNGWFETIGNIPLTEEDKELDYGFWDKEIIGSCGSFYKANGEVLDHMPKYFDSYGVTSLNGVYMELRKEAIINPSLLTL